MKKISLLVLPLIVSCNIYAPFAQKSSTEDLVEEGRKCLHDNNFGCAIEAYNAIPDAETKQEKLCLAYLAQGGVTLEILITTLTQGTAKVLGDIAQGLMPWSSDKSTALDNAKTACVAYTTLSSTTKATYAGSLLKALSLIANCCVRMAKADQFGGTSNSDTDCSTAGDRNGTLSQADIADNSNGEITSKGMCVTDVIACNENIISIDSVGLSVAGLVDIKNATDLIPAALKTSSAATNAVRGALRDTVR